MLNKQIQEEKDQQEPVQLNWKLWVGLGALSMTGLFFLPTLIMGEFIGVIPLFATLILGAFFLGRYFRNFSQTKRTLWLAILAVISLPIAIPLLLILLASLLGLVALILALIVGAFVLGVGLLTSGGYLIWEAFSLMSEGFNIFLMGFGSGLSLIGGAILIYILTGFLPTGLGDWSRLASNGF